MSQFLFFHFLIRKKKQPLKSMAYLLTLRVLWSQKIHAKSLQTFWNRVSVKIRQGIQFWGVCFVLFLSRFLMRPVPAQGSRAFTVWSPSPPSTPVVLAPRGQKMSPKPVQECQWDTCRNSKQVAAETQYRIQMVHLR